MQPVEDNVKDEAALLPKQDRHSGGSEAWIASFHESDEEYGEKLGPEVKPKKFESQRLQDSMQVSCAYSRNCCNMLEND